MMVTNIVSAHESLIFNKHPERCYLCGRICSMCCIATLAFAVWYKTVILGVELKFVENYELLTHS